MHSEHVVRYVFRRGNLIFPVQLGQNAGSNVWVATLGFLITA
ncbi:MAG: branched-chain amino acid transport system II carrier protein [Christensenellales bacterium]